MNMDYESSPHPLSLQESCEETEEDEDDDDCIMEVEGEEGVDGEDDIDGEVAATPFKNKSLKQPLSVS